MFFSLKQMRRIVTREMRQEPDRMSPDQSLEWRHRCDVTSATHTARSRFDRRHAGVTVTSFDVGILNKSRIKLSDSLELYSLRGWILIRLDLLDEILEIQSSHFRIRQEN